MKYFLLENEQQALSFLKKNNIPVDDKNFIKLKNQVEEGGLIKLLGFFTILYFKYKQDLVWIEDIIHLLKPLILKKQLSLIKGYNGDFNSLLSEDLLERLKEADLKSDGIWVVKRFGSQLNIKDVIGEENTNKLIEVAGKAYKLDNLIKEKVIPYIKRILNNPSKEQIDHLYKFLLSQLDDKFKIKEKYINKMKSLKKENIGSLIYYKNKYAVFWCFNEKATQELADITTYCSKSNSSFLEYENLKEGGNYYLFFNFNLNIEDKYFVIVTTIYPNLEVSGTDDRYNNDIKDKTLQELINTISYPSDILPTIQKYYKSKNYKDKNKEKLHNIIKLNISLYNGYLLNELDKFENLEELYISVDNLTSLPESIGNLTNLEKLNIYINNLTSLPESIGNLINLKELDIYDSNLTSLPESIGNLTNLNNLRINNNNLTSLPESIGNLIKLNNLRIDNNNLTSLPESIGNLTNLEKLNISSNNLTSIPNSIGNLTNLKILHMNNNKLTKFPTESIGNLTNLEELYIYNNNLTSLPESIGNLTNLKVLYFDYKLISLPQSLRNKNIRY